MELIWTFGRRDKSVSPAGVRTADYPAYNLDTIWTKVSGLGEINKCRIKVIISSALISLHVSHTGVYPKFCLGGGGGASTEATYNSCLILKSVLSNSCRKYVLHDSVT